MRILYDASRLMSRAERSAPTGVDRVCLAYAEWLLARPDVLVLTGFDWDHDGAALKAVSSRLPGTSPPSGPCSATLTLTAVMPSP